MCILSNQYFFVQFVPYKERQLDKYNDYVFRGRNIMGAIVGIHHFNKEPISDEHIYRLMKSFQKYPSDDIDIWNHTDIFFGCHNQWITPQSIGEQMPYHDYERQLVITADAIIDNREELCRYLKIDYQERKIMPDSQLILLAYYKWGEEVPKYLLGDFAFMIWDERKRKLFGARDFSGARTLYYHESHNRFVFSTTMEPLFTLPYIERRLNEAWLAEFLVIPNIVEAVDMFSTVYKNVMQVPPSHSITVVGGKVSLTRYCLIDVQQELKLNSNEEYEEAFRDVFDKAVSVRLRTHGEVGSHLSGGLDSGTVVSFAAKELRKQNKRLHTFSYIPEASFVDWTDDYYIADESPYIKETVNYLGNISDQYLSFDGKSPLSEVDDFLEIMEMPYKFFDNTFWLKGINATASKQGVKVLLNGARGNHSISWGSMTLTFDYYADLFKKGRWTKLFNELDAYCKLFKTGKKVMIPFVAKRALSITNKNRDNGGFPLLINPALAAKTNVLERIREHRIDLSGRPIKNLAEYRRNYYQQLFAWNKSGVAGTQLSLRYALWDRDPTNDLNVIRFCLSLPEEQYATGGMGRSMIRRAMKNQLPNKVRLNQQSRGIQGADVIHRMESDWEGFLSELDELIHDPLAYEYINIEVIKNALKKIGNEPRPELVFNDAFKILPRSLIVYRFLKKIS